MHARYAIGHLGNLAADTNLLSGFRVKSSPFFVMLDVPSNARPLGILATKYRRNGTEAVALRMIGRKHNGFSLIGRLGKTDVGRDP